MGEHRHGEPVLVAVEGTLRLPDHHRAEAAVRVGERGEQFGGAGTAAPRQGPGLPDVEVLRDDDSARWLDQGAGAGELPVPGCLGVLVVLGGDAAGESERDRA